MADKRPDDTREMRLVSQLIALSEDVADTSLAQFLARRRRPNDDLWSTWDQITIELHKLTGEVFTDVSLRRWASRYGIPQGTQEFGGTHSQSEYAEALEKVGISI